MEKAITDKDKSIVDTLWKLFKMQNTEVQKAFLKRVLSDGLIGEAIHEKVCLEHTSKHKESAIAPHMPKTSRHKELYAIRKRSRQDAMIKYYEEVMKSSPIQLKYEDVLKTNKLPKAFLVDIPSKFSDIKDNEQQENVTSKHFLVEKLPHFIKILVKDRRRHRVPIIFVPQKDEISDLNNNGGSLPPNQLETITYMANIVKKALADVRSASKRGETVSRPAEELLKELRKEI